MTVQRDYFIKAGYQPNDENKTMDEVSGEVYWDNGRVKASYLYQFPVYEYLSRIISEKKITSMIDIGCGVASKLGYLHEKHPDLKIVGIDQPNAIEYCKKNYDFGEWIVDDFEKPSLPSNIAFGPDLIICSDVIEHLIDPDVLLKYIHKIATPDTIVVLSTPDRDLLRGEKCMVSPNKYHIREWSGDEFKKYIDSRGFDVLEHLHQLPIKCSLNRLLFSEIILRMLKLQNLRYNQVVVLRVKSGHDASWCS
ncbi:class I SAM-dependent methyltransferase [Hahella ganghwensis]|uniref:class I SAM-dependent methyltransferase n=1 Tax=Hahella ganghwensis TaxID=286420 RepID=UPI0003624051|nr:class I SAM-dependent methyltransferase [Hahella ganghwensis]